MANRFDLRVWGARGSLPLTTGSRYGGNTSCIEVRHGDSVSILDAGSGIVPLGRELARERVASVDIFLSHAHYDHVIGLPFFQPLHCPGTRVTLWYAGDARLADAQALLAELLKPPFLPFSPSDLRCELRFGLLPRSGTIHLDTETRLTTRPVNHPGGAVGMRLARGAASFVYVPDFEHDNGPMDDDLVALMQGTDLALLDCTYTPEEYPAYRGYGHSHWGRCAELAARAGVGRMGMFHHNHTSTDAEIDAAQTTARRVNPAVFATREGMLLTPGAPGP